MKSCGCLQNGATNFPTEVSQAWHASLSSGPRVSQVSGMKTRPDILRSCSQLLFQLLCWSSHELSTYISMQHATGQAMTVVDDLSCRLLLLT